MKKSGGYRIILDLSQPFGGSVNDFIDKGCYSMKYSKFDDAVALVQKAGVGALMGKHDIKSAFRLVPVRMADWHLLGYCIDDLYYFDVVLPFGCRSSPFLLCQFSQALHWIFSNSLGHDPLTHYVDDYFFVGRPNSSQCLVYMTDFMRLCGNLGVPLADDKLELPIPINAFGNSHWPAGQTIALPSGRLAEIILLINECQ